jgi:hypothetical protein
VRIRESKDGKKESGEDLRQRFYRGPDYAYASASGQGGTPVQFGRGGGGGNNRFQASGGRRPYNRGWVPRGKRHN